MTRLSWQGPERPSATRPPLLDDAPAIAAVTANRAFLAPDDNDEVAGLITLGSIIRGAFPSCSVGY